MRKFNKKGLVGLVFASSLSIISPLCAQERSTLDLYGENRIEYAMKTDNSNYSIKEKLNNKRKKPIYKEKGFWIASTIVSCVAFYCYKEKRKKKKEPIVPQSPDNKDPIQPPDPLSLHFLKYNNQMLGEHIQQKKKKYDLRINLSLPVMEW